MIVEGKHYQTVWAEESSQGLTVKMIDQPRLPHEFRVAEMRTHRDTARAIREMTIRGAPAIGAAGAYGFAQAAAEAPLDGSREAYLDAAYELLRSTRPTAYDLFYMLDKVREALGGVDPRDQAEAALSEARRLAAESAERCRKIGEAGQALIADGMRVLTHCNAGWLACVDWGTALSPMYHAHRAGKKITVMADETRPRMQGANLTAWELAQ
ncbi:S-methyl-5-thioribose-1-phosphate isomerase, partial [Candidatus Sumerlaeota bacterium]|nr:S-methyl-5-thioribose-1-phosphate isomerase [Candidatus Sumerlaeota bacterium]